MTEAGLERLDRIFRSEPVFEFVSPEGRVGYPSDLLELDADEVQRFIGALRAYECEAAILPSRGASPVPGRAAGASAAQRG